MCSSIIIYFVIIVSVVAFEDFVFGDTTNDIIKKGKLQYQILQEKGKMPQYGECWKSAINNLHDGCKSLSEDQQANIALRFTNCFLEMSGHETYNCDLDVKPNLRRICINSMTDRAFSVYTELYTHTQNICFFLRNQVWHEETEKTIDRLSSSSAHVTVQLEEAGQKTESLLQQQQESINIQERLLKYSDSLSRTIQDSKLSIDNIMEEFRSSTLEQKQLLFDLFENLSMLQSWLLGEVSWFDTIIFYVVSILIILLVTSSKRTSNARALCFIILTLHACIERYLCTMILDKHKLDSIVFLNELLVHTVWWLRRCTIAVLIAVYIYCVYSYCDYNRINYQLLLLLKEQNDTITKMLDNINSSSEYKRIGDNSNLSRTFYQNIDKVDTIRKRLNTPIKNINENDSNDTNYMINDISKNVNSIYSNVNDILSCDNNDDDNSFYSTYFRRKLYSNNIDSVSSTSSVGKKYNLRSNSRNPTPDISK